MLDAKIGAAGDDSAAAPVLEVEDVTLQYKTKDYLVTVYPRDEYNEIIPNEIDLDVIYDYPQPGPSASLND